MRATDINATMNRLRKVLDKVQDPKERRRITDRAAKPIIERAASRAPKSKEAHFRYVSSPIKLNKKLKSRRGAAKSLRIKYLPGNLRLSIRSLTHLRRRVFTVLGPKIKGRSGANAPIYGNNRRNVDAYYAQMIFGSAVEFRKRIMQSALNGSRAGVTNVVFREVRKVLEREKAKQGVS
jgi:hypothetical protein